MTRSRALMGLLFLLLLVPAAPAAAAVNLVTPAKNTTTATALSLTVNSGWAPGTSTGDNNTVVVVVAFKSPNGTVTSITDNATGGSSLYTKRASITASSASKVELGSTAAGTPQNATSITVNLFQGMDMVVTVASYSGVVSLGQTPTTSVNSGSISQGNPPAQISLTTSDSNNWVVAGFAAGGSSAFTASAGTIRQQAVASGPVGGALMDNTSATPGTVSNTLTIDSGAEWTSMAALELRTVPAPYYFNSASAGMNNATQCLMTLPQAAVPGHTNIVVVAMNPSTSTVKTDGTGVTDGASTYTKQIAVNNGSARVEMWTATIAPGASNTVTVNLTANAKGPCMVAQYALVVGIGTPAQNTGTSMNPSIPLTMQVANSLVVAGFANQGSASITTSTGTPTQSIGILRQASATSSGGNASNACGALVENTSTTVPASVTNAVAILQSAAWAAAAIELRGPQWNWNVATSAATMAPPALDPWSNLVASGSNDTKLYVVADADGVRPPAFSPFTTGGAIQSRPAVIPASYRRPATAVNIAYFGSQDGKVYAVDTSTGSLVTPGWPTAQLGPVGTTIQGGAAVWLQAVKPFPNGAVTSDVVFVGTSNTNNDHTGNKVYAVNGVTGATVWTFAPGNMDIISSTPYVDYANNAVWVTSRSNGVNQQKVLWKLNAADGASLVTKTLANLGDTDTTVSAGIDSSPSPSTDGIYIYVGTNTGKLSAIRASDGAVVANYTPASGSNNITEGTPWPLSYDPVGPATPDQIIFTEGTWVHSVYFDGSAFILSGPQAPWNKQLTGTPAVSAPVDAGSGGLYIGGNDSQAHQLDVATGTDQKQVIVSAQTGLIVGDATFNWDLNRIHVGASDGHVYTFGVPFP